MATSNNPKEKPAPKAEKPAPPAQPPVIPTPAETTNEETRVLTRFGVMALAISKAEELGFKVAFGATIITNHAAALHHILMKGAEPVDPHPNIEGDYNMGVLVYELPIKGTVTEDTKLETGVTDNDDEFRFVMRVDDDGKVYRIIEA